MTEYEKMTAGMMYDPAKDGLPEMRVKAHDLCREYNTLTETDARRDEILSELLKSKGDDVMLQGPIQFDYGSLTAIGNRVFANFNFTCVDCCPVTIGDNVFFGPDVSILTPLHPMRWQDRNMFVNDEGMLTDLEYAKPVIIEENCWIAGNVTICGGVTIGRGSVIGAGSVVTRDIPEGSFAAGVPCRVVREI